MRKHLGSALGGLSVSTTFFLPIAAAGSIGAPMLMWEMRHTMELACAWLALAVVATGVLVWTAGLRRPRLEAALLLGLIVPSLVSILVVTGRNSSLTRETVDSVRAAAMAGALVTGVTGIALWAWRPRWLVWLIRTTLPFGVLLLYSGVRAIAALPAPVPPGASEAGASNSTCRSVYVLLFDELAYEGVFEGDVATLKSVASRLSSARVYWRAAAPAGSTEGSVSTYLSVSHIRGSARAPGSATLFGAAKAAGLVTEAIGWYFPYCEALGSTADRCRSFSMYNAGTIGDGFNPLAPFATALNIWPYQMPFGVVKRPVAVWFHRAQFDAILARASAPPDVEPVFRWIHLNVPHVPWLRDTGVLWMKAFEHSRERYLAQRPSVDAAVERVFSALEASGRASRTTVVLSADHGLRWPGIPEPMHVPLIVWEPGGARQDVREEVKVGDVISEAVLGACRGPGPGVGDPESR